MTAPRFKVAARYAYIRGTAQFARRVTLRETGELVGWIERQDALTGMRSDYRVLGPGGEALTGWLPSFHEAVVLFTEAA